MRMLNVICGVAVLLATLHLTHAIHHFWRIAAVEGVHGLAFWAGILSAVTVGIFSLIGGCLLLRSGR